MNEMHTYIAGSPYHEGSKERIPTLLLEEELKLVREKDNPHDRKAVAVHDDKGLKLGYVPRADAPTVAKVLDRGLPSCAFYRGAPHSTSIMIYWEV